VSTSIEFSKTLKRRVRKGDPFEQAKSTWLATVEAIDRRDAEDAAALAQYVVDEIKIHCDVMAQWRADLRAFLVDKGVTVQDLNEAEERILSLLDLPDGTAYDIPTLWNDYQELTLRLQAEVHHGKWDEAKQTVDEARELWRRISDRDVDWCCGVMNEVVVRLGEEAIPEMYDRILGPLFTWRYDKFDVSKADWETESLPALLYVALEAMRAYLSTAWRDGSALELHEFEDRWVLRFDPCGSGGRFIRGDWIEETPSRLEPPYSFKRIEGAYDWTDGKAGICVYCNHCQVLLEHMPMDKFGYPVRVIEPPIYPDNARDDTRQKCQWTMYKDPTAVPEEIYERAGRKKPTEFGSKAHGGDTDTLHTGFIGGG
jgi:hypothetical protein